MTTIDSDVGNPGVRLTRRDDVGSSAHAVSGLPDGHASVVRAGHGALSVALVRHEAHESLIDVHVAP